MIRSRLLRENGQYIPKSAFLMRRHFFNNAETGYFKTQKRPPVSQNPMADPSMMTDMLKGNVTNVLPMVLIGGWINWMFSGFVTSESFSSFFLCHFYFDEFACLSDRCSDLRIDFFYHGYYTDNLFVFFSKSTIPPDSALQANAAERHRVADSGRSVGVLRFLVFPQRFWTSFYLHSSTRREQCGGHVEARAGSGIRRRNVDAARSESRV